MPDIEVPHVVATIPVGTGPVGVAADLHDRVFVANRGDGTVSVIDSGTGTVSGTLRVGAGPESVATDPQFGVCVANSADGTVTAIDKTNTVIATIALEGPPPSPFGPPAHSVGVAIDHFLARAYVAVRGHHRVAVIGIGGALPAVAHDFVDVPGPLGLAVGSPGHRVFVTQPDAGTVSVIDPSAHEAVASIPVRQHPAGVAVDPGRHRVHVANSGSGTVSSIDTATGEVDETEVGAEPFGVAVDTARGDVYVTRSDGVVAVIDAGSARVNATVPVGSRPEGVAFEPHSRRVYVANRGDGTVSAIGLPAG
jgi:YVTN family beta-propeller protein